MSVSQIVVVDKTSPTFSTDLLTAFTQHHIHLYGQLGWLPRTPTEIVDAYIGWNQHPGPIDPPGLGFGSKGMWGMRVHAAVWYFARHCGRDFPFTEATAQLVHSHYDEGTILGVVPVPLSPDDTPESIQQRVLPAEHQLQITALKKLLPYVRRDAGYNLSQVKRETPLIWPGEEALLEEAKRYAAIQYPHG